MPEALRLPAGAIVGGRPRAAGVPDSPRGSIAVGLAVIAIFFAGLGGWAAVAPLDGAVTGEGVVTVEGNRKSVAEVDGGTVTQITVTEGAQVKAGEVLLTLDDAKARTELNIDRQQLLLAEIHLAGLEAELDRRDFIEFPRDLLDSQETYAGEAMASEAVDFEARRSAFADLDQSTVKQVEDLKEQIDGKQGRVAADQSQVASMVHERDELSGLLSGGLTTKGRSLDLERNIQQLYADIADAKVAIASLNQAIVQIEQQDQQAINGRRSDAATDLFNTRAKVLQLRSTVDNAQVAADRLAVKATYDGRVVNLRVFSTGAVLQPGSTILDIVPTQLPLVINARIPVDEVAQIKTGASAEIRFPAFQRPDMPSIEGTVRRISADRLLDDHTGAAYFEVEVAVSAQMLQNAGNLALYPGMSSNVIIHTEHRTALQYLLSPLAEALAVSFRQR